MISNLPVQSPKCWLHDCLSPTVLLCWAPLRHPQYTSSIQVSPHDLSSCLPVSPIVQLIEYEDVIMLTTTKRKLLVCLFTNNLSYNSSFSFNNLWTTLFTVWRTVLWKRERVSLVQPQVCIPLTDFSYSEVHFFGLIKSHGALNAENRKSFNYLWIRGQILRSKFYLQSLKTFWLMFMQNSQQTTNSIIKTKKKITPPSWIKYEDNQDLWNGFGDIQCTHNEVEKGVKGGMCAAASGSCVCDLTSTQRKLSSEMPGTERERQWY